MLGIAEDNMDKWDNQYSGKVHKCWQKVMKHWLKGAGAHSDQYPPTWDGLYTLLRNAKYSKVAEQLEEAVRAVKLSPV
jgi:hypothetical protein